MKIILDIVRSPQQYRKLLAALFTLVIVVATHFFGVTSTLIQDADAAKMANDVINLILMVGGSALVYRLPNDAPPSDDA